VTVFEALNARLSVFLLRHLGRPQSFNQLIQKVIPERAKSRKGEEVKSKEKARFPCPPRSRFLGGRLVRAVIDPQIILYLLSFSLKPPYPTSAGGLFQNYV
jgi:hypothetical protein